MALEETEHDTKDKNPANFSVETGKEHVFISRPEVCRVRLIGMHFDTNKNFLLPSAMPGIRKLVELWKGYEKGEVLLVGHTDTTGDSTVNDPLSVRRAKSVAAYLQDNVDEWLEQFASSTPSKQRWGIRETLLMITALPSAPQNDAVEDSIRWFQNAFKGEHDLGNNPVDGISGPKTRKAVITEYMALDDTTLPSDLVPVIHGCGENFPEVESGDDVDESQNRRVEMFVFEKTIDPPAPGQNSQKGAAEYPEWIKQLCFTYDLKNGDKPEDPKFEFVAPVAGIAHDKLKKLFADETHAKSDEDNTVLQYVNLDSTESGRDGMDSKVIVQIGVVGDRELHSPNRQGKAGLFAFIEVEFGAHSDAGDKSKRNIPLTELKEGNDLSDREEVEANKKYKGKVELKSDEELGEFLLELGLAGGDNCTIKIGNTEACEDATLIIVNWRRLEYETIYPDFMEPTLSAVNVDGNAYFDIPASIKTHVVDRLGAAYVRYELHKSSSFAEAQAVQGTVVDAAFIAQDGGKKYILSGAWAQNDPIAFSAPVDDRRMQIRLCDNAYGSSIKTAVRQLDLNVAEGRIVPGDGESSYYLQYVSTASDGALSLELQGDDGNDYEWLARVPNGYVLPPIFEHTVNNSANPVAGSTDRSKVVNIQCKLPDDTITGSHSITFTGGRIGHVASSLNQAQKTELELFVKGCLGTERLRDKLKKNDRGMEFLIDIQLGDGGSSSSSRRRQNRADNIIAALENSFDSQKENLPLHPGLDDSGNARHGPMQREWLKHADHRGLKLELPTKDPGDDEPLPGDLVGDLSDDKCKVRIRFKIHSTYGINGNAGSGKQVMVIRTESAASCSSTVCHELGHSMGMTIMAGRSKIPPGMDAAKHVDNGGVFYVNSAAPFVNGKRAIHKGPHCATGVPDSDLPASNFNGSDGSCIMYGSGGRDDTRPAYCAPCKEYIRGRKLVDIRSSWQSRSPNDY